MSSGDTRTDDPPILDHHDGKTLRACVKVALEYYFAHLDGHDTSGLYQLVLNEVEKPLLEAVLDQAGGNQSRAATMLGMSRSTLRKKLAQHGMV